MSSITVRMDYELKRELEEALYRMELTVTAAMTICARAMPDELENMTADGA